MSFEPVYCSDLVNISATDFNSMLGGLEKVVGGRYSVGNIQVSATPPAVFQRLEQDALFVPYSKRPSIIETERGKYSVYGRDLLVVPKNSEFRVHGLGALMVLMGDGMYDGLDYVRADDLKQEPGIGGKRIMLKGFDRKGNADVHLIWVDEENRKIPHYHERLAEIYFVLEGVGKMVIRHRDKPGKQFEFPLKEHSLFVVPPGYIHQAVHEPDERMIIQVVGLPKFFPDDVHRVSE